MKDKRLNIFEECERCLLCQDAPCTKACKTGDTARAIRAIRPIAMRHIFELASMPQKTELSGLAASRPGAMPSNLSSWVVAMCRYAPPSVSAWDVTSTVLSVRLVPSVFPSAFQYQKKQ